MGQARKYDTHFATMAASSLPEQVRHSHIFGEGSLQDAMERARAVIVTANVQNGGKAVREYGRDAPVEVLEKTGNVLYVDSSYVYDAPIVYGALRNAHVMTEHASMHGVHRYHAEKRKKLDLIITDDYKLIQSVIDEKSLRVQRPGVIYLADGQLPQEDQDILYKSGVTTLQKADLEDGLATSILYAESLQDLRNLRIIGEQLTKDINKKLREMKEDNPPLFETIAGLYHRIQDQLTKGEKVTGSDIKGRLAYHVLRVETLQECLTKIKNKMENPSD